MSWYSTGSSGINQEEQRLAAVYGPNRLWVKPGTGIEVILADDETFNIQEHNAKLNGNWRNHHTCEGTGCESCLRLGPKSRAYTGYLTAVNCTAWVDKKGNKHQYELQLCGGKLDIQKKWRRKKEEHGSLILRRIKVHREDAKKSAVGDEWTIGEAVKDEAKLFSLLNYKGKLLSEMYDTAEKNAANGDQTAMAIVMRTFDVKPVEGVLPRKVPTFNYMEVLKPRGNEFIKGLLGNLTREQLMAAAEGTGSGGEGGAAEDDIPF